MEQFWHEPRRSGMLMSVVAVQPDKLSVRPYTTLYQQTTDSVLSQLFALLLLFTFLPFSLTQRVTLTAS